MTRRRLAVVGQESVQEPALSPEQRETEAKLIEAIGRAPSGCCIVLTGTGDDGDWLEVISTNTDWKDDLLILEEAKIHCNTQLNA